MRIKVRLSPEAAQALKRAQLPVVGAIFAVLLMGAYSLGASREAALEPLAPTVSRNETPPPGSEPVKVPDSPGAARSTGVGGQTWTSGDTGRLASDFKQSVSHQFHGGSVGEAQRAMASMGFDCALGDGDLQCEKTMKADNCTLTWSVKLRSSGGAVRGAGGEGFNRECS